MEINASLNFDAFSERNRMIIILYSGQRKPHGVPYAFVVVLITVVYVAHKQNKKTNWPWLFVEDLCSK